MANIVVVKNVLGFVQTNCYSIVNTDTREVIVIDPGDREDFLITTYKSQNIKPVAILLTHGHFDHISAVMGLKKEYPDTLIYVAREEKEVLNDPSKNLTPHGNRGTFTIEADVYLDDNQIIELLGVEIKCLLVPGHTKGGMCYYIESENMVFSGDTLFKLSIGRSDFSTGNFEALINGIKTKLLTLPNDTVVYPGHDDKTLIEYEKKYNQFLK